MLQRLWERGFDEVRIDNVSEKTYLLESKNRRSESVSLPCKNWSYRDSPMRLALSGQVNTVCIILCPNHKNIIVSEFRNT